MKNIYVEAHRGWRSRFPENTIPAYTAAVDEPGIDAMEFDIRLSKDGVPVIMHDSDSFRLSGEHVCINDLTLDEIKRLDVGSFMGEQFKDTRVPTFEEILKLVSSKRPDFKLGVEFKDYDEHCVDISIAMLKEYGLFDNCWFYCFNARIIKYIKQKYNGRTMGYPDFQMKEFEADSYDYYDEIGISTTIMHSEVFPIYKKKNMPMHMYCADTEELVRECIDNGASLITANDPLPLMRVLGRK